MSQRALVLIFMVLAVLAMGFVMANWFLYGVIALAVLLIIGAVIYGVAASSRGGTVEDPHGDGRGNTPTGVSPSSTQN